MKIGTRSILFGVHQFALHPMFLFVAWWRLYGFPWHPALWVAFVVHDLGYWGKPNMDGPEGEEHPRLGAKIMEFLFDWDIEIRWRSLHSNATGFTGHYRTLFYFRAGGTWHDFTLFHSRFFAKKLMKKHSRLCVADKLATIIMPAWLYLALANLSGEVHEYMDVAHHKEGSKYQHMQGNLSGQREWFESMRSYMSKWIAAHKDGQQDTWTPEARDYGSYAEIPGEHEEVLEAIREHIEGE